jgi:hypothetical protein
MGAGMDLFSEALTLLDSAPEGEQAALELVARSGGSVERLLEAERRARALERALPDDLRARRLHELVRQAACVAMKTPCDQPSSSSLRDRLGGAAIDVDQLEADLQRLRTPIAPQSG